MAGHIGYVCRFCGTLTKFDTNNKYRGQKLCLECGSLIARVLYNEDGIATDQDAKDLQVRCKENESVGRMVPILARQRWHLGPKESHGLRCIKCKKCFGTEVKHGLHTKNLCIDCETLMYLSRSETRFVNRLEVDNYKPTRMTINLKQNIKSAEKRIQKQQNNGGN
jgi:hypothetical protein